MVNEDIKKKFHIVRKKIKDKSDCIIKMMMIDIKNELKVKTDASVYNVLNGKKAITEEQRKNIEGILERYL